MGKFTDSRILRDMYASSVAFHVMLLVGMDLTFTSYFSVHRDNLPLREEALLGSINIFFRPIGAIIATFLTHRIGRKRIIQVALLTNTIGWTLIATTPSHALLYIGRTLTGIAAGTQGSSSIYVFEVCHEHNKRVLISMQTLFLSLGNFLPVLVGYSHHWKFVSEIAVIISVSGLVQALCIPETKHWYISQGRHTEAEESLLWFSPNATAEEVQAELMNTQTPTSTSGICDIFRDRESFKSFISASVLLTLIGGTGRLPILTHLEHFLIAFQASFDSKKLSIALGVTDLVSSFAYAVLAGFLNLRNMLYGLITSLTLSLLGILIYDWGMHEFNVSAPLIPITFLYFYVTTVVTGLFGSVSIMLNEITKDEHRGMVINLAICIAFLFTGLYSFALPYILESADINVLIAALLINIVLIFIVVRCFVPETVVKEYRRLNPAEGDESEEECWAL